MGLLPSQHVWGHHRAQFLHHLTHRRVRHGRQPYNGIKLSVLAHQFRNHRATSHQVQSHIKRMTHHDIVSIIVGQVVLFDGRHIGQQLVEMEVYYIQLIV